VIFVRIKLFKLLILVARFIDAHDFVFWKLIVVFGFGLDSLYLEFICESMCLLNSHGFALQLFSTVKLDVDDFSLFEFLEIDVGLVRPLPCYFWSLYLHYYVYTHIYVCVLYD
jgi:hypothetical protein